MRLSSEAGVTPTISVTRSGPTWEIPSAGTYAPRERPGPGGSSEHRPAAFLDRHGGGYATRAISFASAGGAGCIAL